MQRRSTGVSGGVNEGKMEGQERVIKPKPKLTKAERREIQERQRAAKASARTGEQAAGAAGLSGGKHGQASSLSPSLPRSGHASAGQKQAGGQQGALANNVHMFSHLEQNRGVLPLTSKGDIHPAILALGRKYSSGEVTGATARAVAMLMAFKQVVMDYSTPPDKMLSWDLDKRLRPMMQYLIDCRPHSVSMGNAHKALRNIIAKSPPSLPEEEAKASIADKINEFINTRITLAANEIAKNAITKIRDGDVILTYGSRSSLVESVLVAAQQAKRGSFRVIIVDSRPGVEGRQLSETLSAEGIPCTYVLLTAISYIMREVTKVFIGASAMMSNGAVLSRVGTAVVAMMARSHNLPIMFCCETYKFCERVQLDSIVYNELGQPHDLISDASGDVDEFKALPSLKLLNLRYDLTPIKYVTLVITEFGFLPPTSVPVLIRELTRREDKDEKY
ncbi:unnamed protein product [Ectocarpus sp. 12 AP-2014]